MKARVKELYKAKEPKKSAGDITKLLKQYKGKDEKLKSILKKKYKLKPPLDLHATFKEQVARWTRATPTHVVGAVGAFDSDSRHVQVR